MHPFGNIVPIGEYTGLVQCDPGPERDDYSFGLPGARRLPTVRRARHTHAAHATCAPPAQWSSRTCASRRGGTATSAGCSTTATRPTCSCARWRTRASSASPPSRPEPTAAVAPGEQLLVDYGPPYWRAHGRSKVALGRVDSEQGAFRPWLKL